MTRQHVDVAILGGGYSGLSAALRLADEGLEVAVFEKQDRLGGLAACHEVDGHSVERYYHHLFTTDLEVASLAERLDAADRLVWREVRQGIYIRGELHPFTTPLDLLTFSPIPLAQRIRLGLLTRGALGDGVDLDRLSTEEWITEHVGAETYERLFGPLVWAKFGTDGSEISAAFVRGRLLARGESRGRFGWRERLGYVDGGSDVLADGLAAELGALEATVRTGAAVSELVRVDDGFEISVDSERGSERLHAGHVVCSLPTAVLGKISRNLPERFLASLDEVDYRCVVVATVGLRRSLSPYYWISVADRTLPFNALIEHTRLHPPEHYGGAHVLYIGKYLPPSHPLWSKSDDEVIEAYLEGLGRVFPSLEEDDVLWWRMSRDRFATPLFTTGYGRTLEAIEEGVPRLRLAGTLKVYPDSRNVNSAIRIGRDAAAAILENLE